MFGCFSNDPSSVLVLLNTVVSIRWHHLFFVVVNLAAAAMNKQPPGCPKEVVGILRAWTSWCTWL